MVVAVAVIAVLVGGSWYSVGDEEGPVCESVRASAVGNFAISTFTFTTAVAHRRNYVSAIVEVRGINACIAKVHCERTSSFANYKLPPTLRFQVSPNSRLKSCDKI